MRVYIAAPFSERDRANNLRRVLERGGIEVTSSWLTDEHGTLSDAWARIDLEDVERADALLAINPAEWAEKGTGGRHVELGYALALRRLCGWRTVSYPHPPMRVIVLGAPTNIFHFLDEVELVNEFEDIVGILMRPEHAV